MKPLHLISALLLMPLAASAAVAPASVDPAAGATLAAIHSITITYPAGTAVEVANAAALQFASESGTIEVTAARHPRKANVVAVDMADGQQITAPGQYYFLAPEGAFTVSGEPSAEIECTYTVGTPEPTPEPDPTPEPEPDPTPEPAFNPADYISIRPATGDVLFLSNWSVEIAAPYARNFDNRSAGYHLSAADPAVELPALTWQSTQVSLAGNAFLTTPGTYTLTMDEGMFTIFASDADDAVGYPNPRMEFEYTIVDPQGERFPAYTISPEAGTYKSLGKVTFTFDTAEPVHIDASAVSLTSPTAEVPVIVAESGANTFTVTPATASGKATTLTTEGSSVLIIEAGAITVGRTFNPRPISLVYVLTPRAGQGNWTGEAVANPADGTEVESLSHIDFTFTGAAEVRVNDFATPSDFPTVYASSGHAVTQGSAFASLTSLSISLFEAVNMPGEYTLVVPRQFITVDGTHPSADLRATYTVVGKENLGKYTYATDPVDGGDLNYTQPVDIAFEGPGLTSVSHNAFAWGATAPHFTSADGYFCPSVQTAPTGDSSYRFTHLYPFEAPGIYTLEIPSGFFTFSYSDGTDAPGMPMEVSFHVSPTSGVDTPQAADAPATRYFDLSGRPIAAPVPGTPHIRITAGHPSKALAR